MAQIKELTEDEGGITCMSVDNIKAKKNLHDIFLAQLAIISLITFS